MRRRLFLGSLGAAGASLTVAACQDRTPRTPAPDGSSTTQVPLPDPVVRTEPPTTLRFLNDHQARTVEAIGARIIPGTPEEPGAREAGTVFYVDQLLASHSGYPDPAYMEGPFADTYEGDEPPPEEEGVVWVQEDELERYGRQSAFVPQESYPMGLTRLDELAQERHGQDFVELGEDDQDTLLEAVEDGEDDDVTEIFDELSPSDFFELLRTHTLQGFLADPLYGGNRDMVGWKHVGFPGSRRSFSPEDMFDENYDVTPQSLLDLPAFNADRPAHHHEVPVAVRTRHPNGPRD